MKETNALRGKKNEMEEVPGPREKEFCAWAERMTLGVGTENTRG